MKANTEFGQSNMNCQMVLGLLLIWLIRGVSSEYNYMDSTVHPGPTAYMYAMGGNGDDGRSIERYNYVDDRWMKVGEMNSDRYSYSAGVIGDEICIVGGWKWPGSPRSEMTNSSECWDPSTEKWHQLPSMNTQRIDLGAAVLEGMLYVAGGCYGTTPLKTVERWNPMTRTWSKKLEIAEMSTARSALGVAALGGKLYAVGGWNENGMLSSVERYDPQTNKWTSLAPMHQRRCNLGVGVLNGILYAVGGVIDGPTVLNFVERYDPEVNKWTLVAPISSPRFGHGVCPVGDFLFAAGGMNDKYLDTVEYYDPSKNKWFKASSMPSARRFFGLMAVPNHKAVDSKNEEIKAKFQKQKEHLKKL